MGVDVGPERPHRKRGVSLTHRSPMLDRTKTFGRTLAAYTNAATVVPDANPLPVAVRRAATIQQGRVQLAVFTDDSDHAELRNAVAEAKRANVQLSVFIAPQSLHETDTLPGEHAVPERYRAFERFRRQLAAIDGVTAYEVAPRDRIERVLEAHSPSKTH